MCIGSLLGDIHDRCRLEPAHRSDLAALLGAASVYGAAAYLPEGQRRQVRRSVHQFLRDPSLRGRVQGWSTRLDRPTRVWLRDSLVAERLPTAVVATITGWSLIAVQRSSRRQGGQAPGLRLRRTRRG